MPCEYCLRYFGHHPSCPNYESPNVKHYCTVCEEGIYGGDKYITNDDGEYAHLECVDYAKDLLKFLGYEIKTMEDNE